MMTTTAPVETPAPVDETHVDADVPWVVLVWNDPINTMSYVTFVFQKLFGYSLEKATALMLDVHEKGRAVVEYTIDLIRPVGGCQDRVEIVALK